jgi:hypothetical protein
MGAIQFVFIERGTLLAVEINGAVVVVVVEVVKVEEEESIDVVDSDKG